MPAPSTANMSARSMASPGSASGPALAAAPRRAAAAPSPARRPVLAPGALLTVSLLLATCLLEWDVAWRHVLGPDRRWGDVGNFSLAGLALAAGFAAVVVAETRRRLRCGQWTPGAGDAALILALAGLMRALLFVATPAFHRAPLFSWSGVDLATGPLALAATVAFAGMVARGVTGRVWAATTVSGAAAAFGVVVALSAPWAVRAAAALLGVAPPQGRLDASWWTVAVPLYPLAAAVCLDLCGAWFAPGRAQRSHLYALLSGACAAVPAAAFATHWASVGVGREVMERSGRLVAAAPPPQAPTLAAYVAGAVVAVLLAGPLAAWLGQRGGAWVLRSDAEGAAGR